MSKCWNCGVEIMDPTRVCPLCRCVLEQKDGGTNRPLELSYPKTVKKIKKIQMALNIYLFAAIAAEMILSIINVKTGAHWGLVLLLAVFMAYGYVTLRVSIVMKTGYRLKMILQTLLGCLVVLAIDIFTGYSKWSLNYVFPSAFMLMDLAVIVLMFVNSRNWQSYIPMEMLVIILSIAPLVLYHYGVTTVWFYPTIILMISILVFLGTLLIGGRRARTELYRRFHI